MKILVAGDFCPQQRVAELFGHGDFNTVLGEVKPYVEESDYSIVNFECPVCYGDEKPIEKCGPNLKCSERGIEAAKWVGFDCVTLANNHFLDYGEEGVKNTMAACAKHSIDVVGGGMNLQEASRILYKKIDDKTLAVINCCEHEFSIATETSAGSNPLNPVQQYYAIKEAQTQADYVLVIVHGGHEYYQLPSTRMQETYRFFIDAGADAVVNHHQHCYSGYELYKGKPIVYGLGNFCFDAKSKMSNNWYEGYMILLSFDDNIEFQVIPYVQCEGNASVSIKRPEDFDMKLQRLNQIVSSPEKLIKEQNIFYDSVKLYYCNMLNPVSNRYIQALQSRHLFPNLISEKWLQNILNHVICEAHRDRFTYYLNHHEN